MSTICKAILASVFLFVTACGGDDETDRAAQTQEGTKNDSIYTPLEVDVLAQIVYNPPLSAPDGMVEVDGDVVVHIVIGEDGIVDTAFIEESSKHGPLDTLALNAILKTVWTPAIKDGDRVKMRASFPFMFRIPPPKPGEQTATEE